MKISLVVPAFNEEKLLAASLRSIRAAAAAFEARGWETELIVCDNNSTDSTAEVARAGGACVVFEPVNQISRARNAGAAAATGDWLVFVDADSHPSRELFGEVAAAVLNPRCIGGGSTVLMDEYIFSGWFVTHLWNGLSRFQKWCAGSFIFCEARAFREIGGFSADFFASEEIDFSKRLKAHGRMQGRRLFILHRHPLITSSRKMHLYSRGDFMRLVWRQFRSGGGAVKSRDDCHIWYDGRR